MQDYQRKPQNRASQPAPDIAERLAEAEQGRFVSADSIEEWVASWLTPNELPPPDPDLHIARRP